MIKLLFVPCIIFIFLSCKKVKDPLTNTDTIPTTCTITGSITFFDKNKSVYTTGLNTTTISIDGTSYTTTADALGNYTLSNVAFGMYNLSFTKPGDTYFKLAPINLKENITYYCNGYIFDKPDFILTSGTLKDTTLQIIVSISLTPISYYSNVVIIFGKTDSLDINKPSSYISSRSFPIYPGRFVESIPFQKVFANTQNCPSGSILYAKIYPSNYYYEPYYDNINHVNCYGCCGTPLATTFTLTMP